MVSESPSVVVVALVPGCDDQSRLRDIFDRSRWMLHLAETVESGRRMVADADPGVVITARWLPDGSWTQVLQESEARCVPLIVADRLADELLWSEVLNSGAFDLLRTPFEPSEVRRAVSLAWRYWRDLRVRRLESVA